MGEHQALRRHQCPATHAQRRGMLPVNLPQFCEQRAQLCGKRHGTLSRTVRAERTALRCVKERLALDGSATVKAVIISLL